MMNDFLNIADRKTDVLRDIICKVDDNFLMKVFNETYGDENSIKIVPMENMDEAIEAGGWKPFNVINATKDADRLETEDKYLLINTAYDYLRLESHDEVNLLIDTENFIEYLFSNYSDSFDIFLENPVDKFIKEFKTAASDELGDSDETDDALNEFEAWFRDEYEGQLECIISEDWDDLWSDFVHRNDD